MCVIGFALFMYFVVRPILHRLHRYLSAPHITNANHEGESISQPMVFIAFFVTMVAAFCTSSIGIHSIFGAFMTGLILPRDHGFAHKLSEKIEEFVSVVLLPLYFTLSGLRTNIGSINSGISVAGLIVAVLCACLGKIVGCTIAGVYCGLPRREALAVGILMNTKGYDIFLV